MIARIVLAAVLGAFGWTLMEYLLHRFVGHLPKGKNPLTREHMAHHADPDYFTPWRRKLLLAALIVGFGAVVLLPTLGAVGLAVVIGFVLGWLGYEWIHRRIHTHAPLGRYGDWARRHHLAHHFTDPAMNHGVTLPLWDQLFATHKAAPQVRIPARRVPRWMAHPAGGIDERFAAAYVVAGRGGRGGPAS